MRVRTTLTTLLIVMFLSLSSMASACDVKCALAQGAPACHDTKTGGSAMPPMAGMSGDHVCSKNAASVVKQHPCLHQVCAVQSALASEYVRLDAHLASVAIISPAQIGRFAHLNGLVLIPVRGPPDLPRVSPVSLHTTLLV